MHFTSLFCPCFNGKSQIRFAVRISCTTDLSSIVHYVLNIFLASRHQLRYLARKSVVIAEVVHPCRGIMQVPCLFSAFTATARRGMRVLFRNDMHFCPNHCCFRRRSAVDVRRSSSAECVVSSLFLPMVESVGTNRQRETSCASVWWLRT